MFCNGANEEVIYEPKKKKGRRSLFQMMLNYGNGRTRAHVPELRLRRILTCPPEGGAPELNHH